MPTAWSVTEIEATVAAYFAMLRFELAGVPYVKSEHNERLRQVLDNRTKAAVEYKFQNISAILVNHGQAYIKGYLPAQNYQRAPEASVLEWLAGHDDLIDIASASAVLDPPSAPTVPRFSDILSVAPEPGRAPSAPLIGMPVKL